MKSLPRGRGRKRMAIKIQKEQLMALLLRAVESGTHSELLPKT